MSERDDWIRDRTADGERVVAFQGCARCGGDGHELAFKKFAQPVTMRDISFEWWATCPMTGEPILLTTSLIADAA